MLVLRKTRDRLGVTQDQLEERSGVSRETISRIERDETDPRLSKVIAIADALGVGVDDLIHEDQGSALPTGRGKNTGTRSAAGKRSPGPDSRKGE